MNSVVFRDLLNILTLIVLKGRVCELCDAQTASVTHAWHFRDARVTLPWRTRDTSVTHAWQTGPRTRLNITHVTNKSTRTSKNYVSCFCWIEIAYSCFIRIRRFWNHTQLLDLQCAIRAGSLASTCQGARAGRRACSDRTLEVQKAVCASEGSELLYPMIC